MLQACLPVLHSLLKTHSNRLQRLAGWVAWQIGIDKGWFEAEGVEVEFQWMDYVASMDAYAAGLLDAVTMNNGDALVTGGTGKLSVGILINDFPMVTT